MGMAASQARLLTLTARIHDVEYQAQMIQNAKLNLAIKQDEAYRRYTDALDAQSLTFKTDSGKTIAANFNNLCGKASINNDLSRNYVFRTNSGNLKDDLLILPDEVYDAYQAYNGNDPYEFAMSMIGDISDKANYNTIVENYLNDVLESNNSTPLENIKEQMDTLLKEKILPNTVYADDPKAYNQFNISNMVLGTHSWSAYFKEGKVPNEVRDSIEKFDELKKQFQYKLYSIGVEDIYSKATGEDKSKFAQHEAEFNYYLHWAQLIENEGGIDGCTKISDYGNQDYANDSEFLTKMVESGRITVSLVAFKNGIVDENITSSSSDSNLTMSNTSDVNGTELKKAEAEYEHTLKKISHKDKQYDMDLNRLETERTALTTEYDSVKKVVQDNIERTFKIFS